MTHTAEARERALFLAGRPASEALADATALADGILRRHAATSADYALYRMTEFHADIVDAVASGFRLAARVLDGGALPVEDELGAIVTLIEDKALLGVPLQAMMGIVDATLDALRRTVLERAASADGSDVREANDRLFAYAQHIHTLIPVWYINAAHRERAGAEDGPRVESLLAGRPTGPGTPDRYLVVRLVIDPHADAAPVRTPGGVPVPVPPHVAVKAGHDANEAQRQVTAAFAGALTAPAPHRGLVLIPLAGPVTREVPQLDTLRTVLHEVCTALDAGITAVADVAAVPEIPAALGTTRELARIVARLRYPADLYTLADLAVEYQLTRPGPGRDRLAQRLRALQDNRGLLETLEVHLGNDLDRRRTATALGLHPNTVDHRLKRIAQLTGDDLTRQRGLRRLHAASLVGRYLEQPLPRVAHAERPRGGRLSSR